MLSEFPVLAYSLPPASLKQCRRSGFNPGLGRSPGEGKGYPLQYSGLENSIDYKESGTTERLSLSLSLKRAFSILGLKNLCWRLKKKSLPHLLFLTLSILLPPELVWKPLRKGHMQGRREKGSMMVYLPKHKPNSITICPSMTGASWGQKCHSRCHHTTAQQYFWLSWASELLTKWIHRWAIKIFDNQIWRNLPQQMVFSTSNSTKLQSSWKMLYFWVEYWST